jgi:pimeloyl-ACP methyl ester carboxylesterase
VSEEKGLRRMTWQTLRVAVVIAVLLTAAVLALIVLAPLLLARLPASRVRGVTFSKDPRLGPYILVEVEAGASEALELWERLVEELYPRLRAPVFVVWTGELDVSPAELGRRLGRLLARMRVSLLTLSHPVDAVEELEREW